MTPEDFLATRTNLRLTQMAMAIVLDVARSTVNRWEQGHVAIPRTVELAMETIAKNREKMVGNNYPLMGDILRVMRQQGVDQATAIRSFGVEL